MMNVLQQAYIFDPQVMISSISLVGCGGTGAAWARAICRTLYDMKLRRQHIPTLRLVDPDRVELKNVGRQLFTAADVGQYKAEVLARRFSCSLGLEIEYVADTFSPYRDANHNSLLCGAVDNHAARAAMAAADALWIDCGNHSTSGQVVIGNTAKRDLIRPYKRRPEPNYYHLPYATTIFPALLEPEPPKAETQPGITAGSCAELVEIGDQSLLVNDMVAAVAAQYTYKLLHRQPISTFISFVDTEMLSVRSVPITPDNFSSYLS